VNSHWEAFADDIPWFINDRSVDVGPLLPPGSTTLSSAISKLVPRFARLIGGAHTSRVVIDREPFMLFSWETSASVLAWLAPRPEPAARGLYPPHDALLAEFGGITERGGEFDDQWLLNTTQSLTWREAQHDASFIRDYAGAFEGVPNGIPIDLHAYYSLSREANGNCTLCHRTTGDVLLFAPDHSFDFVTPLEGCPEYTLYRLRGAPRFEDWVEVVAEQWATEWERGRP
jgi:hypothetical protein